ncbi:hypothetical protein MTR62_06680 [Novosphingobium sp. 1949]|uniref:Uncharacterized protein n=1 Tax=Novosphingobium organovorum TaxID=2930092 RepID=A0ABT0BBF0_9SPHN|nr:hypothetical protein [Novosphingobium organovorum]MCJ2182387.1 hypothetical protein [Novosphingobium organovorum]
MLDKRGLKTAEWQYWWGADIADAWENLIMGRMGATSPSSVGLGGDGDELFAIDDVERAFGVELDKADASRWHTAGDLFASLCEKLPVDARHEEIWPRFTEVLTSQTGVDPNAIETESPLLTQSRFWVHVVNVSAAAWIASAVGLLVLAGWALL